MPTTWNRSPEEFHKIYVANTDAFYRVGNAGLAKELDEFMTKCALGLWGVAPLPQWYRVRVSGTAGRTVGRETGSQCRARPQGQWGGAVQPGSSAL